MDLPTVGEPLGPGDPERVGPHVIRRVLGRGGQGIVYLGQSPDHGLVAVKLLTGSGAGGRVDPEAARRFQREAAMAKEVAQFCTAQVLDVGTAADGRPYIAGEYVPGPSLLSLVHEQGPRSGASLDRIAIATATALVALQQAGVVHRDLKPGNVIMCPDGPRVIDFGIARATSADTAEATDIIGTPAYMAPEQLRGEPLTWAVDVFAWASTMVFVATGRPPFGSDAMTTHRILHEDPDLGAVPPPMRDLVASCLAKDPRARPSPELLLSRLLTGKAPTVPSPGLPPQASAAQMLGIGAGLAASSTHPPAQRPLPPVPWTPQPGPMTQPHGQRRSVPLVGVLAGVLVGALAVAAAGIVAWPKDDRPAGAHTPLGTPSPGPTSQSPSSARPTPTKSASASPSKKPSTRPSRTATKKPPPTDGPRASWTAPSLPGVTATGFYDVSTGDFTSSLSLRMTRKVANYATFEHQHSDGGTLCDNGVEWAKYGQTHTSRFGSKCTKMFRVRTCLAKSVAVTPQNTLDIDYIRCTPWDHVRD